MNVGVFELAVCDAETDPFLFGREPIPFSWGFYSEEYGYIDFWGDNATDLFLEFLSDLKTPQLIYAHNGGKFDFHYFLRKGKVFDRVKIINSRIVSAMIGIHEIRDSYAIMPIPLSAYQKDEISYDIFEKEEREKPRNKIEIKKYLKSDCLYLFDLCFNFIERFGLQLTIGGTAIKELRKIHPFENQNDRHDEFFRRFYFGGRVECFDKGIIEGDFKCYDVNSMYPYVMVEHQHPIGGTILHYEKDDLDSNGNIKGQKDKPYFIRFRGYNYGACPMRTKEGLNFNIEFGEFFITSHEYKVGLKYGLIKVRHIIEIVTTLETINFKEFVLKFFEEKEEGKRTKNKVLELFSKLIMNSSYGKFAQSSANYKDYYIFIEGQNLRPCSEEGWTIDMYSSEGIEIYERPSNSKVFYNVATAASITGAARAVLLEGICKAKNPMYCDTDSIICESLDMPLDKFKLGYWDLEGKGNKIAIVGKKTYCLFDGEEITKSASKGVRLTGADILRAAKGEEVLYQNAAPNFKLTGETKFIERKVNIT